jgi:arylsulfatase A-like enzyme
MPDPKNIVCLVVDRLHSGFIGAYGNTWISTPEIDRLAAESFLFDRGNIDSPRLDDLYRSYWQGWHSLANPSIVARVSARELPRQLAAAGYSTALISDERVVSRLALSEAFDVRDELHLAVTEDVAKSIEETHLARFFAAAAERLMSIQSRPPFFLWLHSGSLGKTWDAPLEFRDQYRDTDDPPSPETAAVPCRRLPRDFDPDELLGIMHSYAGQITLLDLYIGSLMETLSEGPFANDTLFVLISARGLPLGEHGRIGPIDEALYGALTQIPWLLKLPGGLGPSERTQALVQPADLFPTLVDWLGLPTLSSHHIAAGKSLLPLVSGASDAVRDRAAIVAAPDERAIVTPAWYMRNSSDGSAKNGGSTRCELFVKPDDRFEVNEVASRCPECVEQLQEAFTQFEQSCQSPESTNLPPLPEALTLGIE